MFWGSLADRTKKYKLIAAVCVTANTAFVCAVAFPLFQGNLRIAYYCFLTAGQCFFSAGTFPMIDAIVLSILESDPSAGKDYYGNQKLWGTVAHNINAKVIHAAYEQFGQDFFVMYYSTVASMLALIGTLLYGVSDNLKIKAHKHHGPSKKEAVDSKKGTVDAGDVATKEEPLPEGSSTVGLLKRPAFFIFLLSILAAGIVRSVNTNNHSIYLTDYLKLDKSAVGDFMLFRLIPEIGLLYFAKNVMVITGPYWFFILGQLAGLVRIMLYLVLTPGKANQGLDYYLLIGMEMLKGVNSSMVSASAFRIASDLAPSAWSGAAQALVGGVWQGVSMTAAALIAFVILNVKGESDENLYWVFAITGSIGIIAFAVILFYYSVVDRKLFALKK